MKDNINPTFLKPDVNNLRYKSLTIQNYDFTYFPCILNVDGVSPETPLFKYYLNNPCTI